MASMINELRLRGRRVGLQDTVIGRRIGRAREIVEFHRDLCAVQH